MCTYSDTYTPTSESKYKLIYFRITITHWHISIQVIPVTMSVVIKIKDFSKYQLCVHVMSLSYYPTVTEMRITLVIRYVYI